MTDPVPPKAPRLRSYNVEKSKNSISGLSSGAFMAVQMHLAHSSSFVGAGIIAGGPYRCAESFRGAAELGEDAYEITALQIGMNPLISETAPDAARLAKLAEQTAEAGKIDPISNLKGHRVYIFTGTNDQVVRSYVVEQTRKFYGLLKVKDGNMEYRDDLEAGHSIITNNWEDSPLNTNQPPYVNYGNFMQSHDILRHIYPNSRDPAPTLSGRIHRFDQTEFFGGDPRASMSKYGYIYVPKAVEDGAKAKVHIALHGCKQGYAYVDYVYGRLDSADRAPYGNRFITTTGYNEIADSNNMIVLYPQIEGRDDADVQNPDGCWDWWGYSSSDPAEPDYYSRDAIQIQAIYRMLSRLEDNRG